MYFSKIDISQTASTHCIKCNYFYLFLFQTLLVIYLIAEQVSVTVNGSVHRLKCKLVFQYTMQ